MPGGRRRALTIAVADYRDGDEDFAKAVHRQVDLVHGWWCDPGLAERGFVAEAAEPLGGRRDVENFLHRSRVRDGAPDDVLFVFVAGHGATAASGRHFLMLPDGDGNRMMANAFPTAEVAAAALDSRAGHVLVVVNACDAGGIDAALAQMRRDLSPARRDTGVLAVLATADFDQSVPIGAFGVLLEQLYDRLRTVSGITSEYLSVNDLMSEMAQVVTADASGTLRPVLRVLAVNEHLPHKALPNPAYRRPDDLVAPGLRQLAVTRTDMDYWISRASGAGDGADGNWFFSGRRDLTRQVAAFLTDGPEPGHCATLIVTGTAGSGKSAVIARAVTLSDPAFRADPRYQNVARLAPPDTLPPVGSVQVAILARNRGSAQILTLLLQALHEPVPLPEPGTDPVRGLLRAASDAVAGAPVTVVIDGLDEADHPYLLITQVIAPLAQLDRPPRLIIGVRSVRPAHTAGNTGAVDQDRLLQLLLRATTIDDRPPRLQRTDGESTASSIAEYLQALLTGTPAAGPQVAWALLGKLPDQASFLDARIAGLQLRGDPDPIRLMADPDWQAGLHLGTVGLLRQDLTAAAGNDLTPEVALTLLRAAAFALGAGIPRAGIWPAIAHAVADRPVPGADAAIEALLGGRLNGYLLTDTEADRTVYRPLHERLAQVLRDQPRLLHNPPEQP